MKKQHKLLKTLLSTVIALSMVFGIMSIALADSTASIVVSRVEESVTIAGSNFEDGQEVGILVLNDGVDSPEDIDTDNPINSIDYIDQVTADGGEFSLTYTTRAQAGSSAQTFKVLATGNVEDTFEVGAITVDGNKISGTVKLLGQAVKEDVDVELINASNEVVETVNPDADGNFEFDEVVAGTYSVRFTKTSYLRLTVTGIEVVDKDISLGVKSLLAGDHNNDDAIDGEDLSKLLAAWETVATDGKYNAKLDFNNDGVIDGEDLSRLLANWEKISSSEEYVAE